MQPLPVHSTWLFDCKELAWAIELHHRESKQLLIPMVLYHLYREFYLINQQQYNHLVNPWAPLYIRYQRNLREMLQPLGRCVVQYHLRYVDAWIAQDRFDKHNLDDLHIRISRCPLVPRGE